MQQQQTTNCQPNKSQLCFVTIFLSNFQSKYLPNISLCFHYIVKVSFIKYISRNRYRFVLVHIKRILLAKIKFKNEKKKEKYPPTKIKLLNCQLNKLSLHKLILLLQIATDNSSQKAQIYKKNILEQVVLQNII